MLVRAGLADGAPGAAAADTAAAPAPGRRTVTRTTPDGAAVEAAVEVDEHGNVAVRVDPRESVALCVQLLPRFGELLVRVEWLEDADDDGWFEQDLAELYPSARAACDAAADWLRAYAPDPPGGDWAAETVRALADVL